MPLHHVLTGWTVGRGWVVSFYFGVMLVGLLRDLERFFFQLSTLHLVCVPRLPPGCVHRESYSSDTLHTLLSNSQLYQSLSEPIFYVLSRSG